MCTTLYFYFCIPYIELTNKNLVSIYHHAVDPLYPLCSPPPLVTTGNHYSVLCIYVFVFVWFVHLFWVVFFCFYIPRMNEIIQNFSFSVCLILLSIIPSRSIHVVTNGKVPSFLWLNSIPLNICTTFSLSIYPLMDT